MSTGDATRAVRRFGLGPRLGDLARIGGDARDYVLASLDDPSAALLTGPELQQSSKLLIAVGEAQRAIRQARQQGAPATPKDARQVAAPPAADMTATKTGDAPRPAPIQREAFVEDARARLEHAIATDKPFLERLVMFWSNHFCVSAAKGPGMRAIAGAYEREAIRPHVLGRFADMLKAVEQHPAMLIYLDNQLSIGPNSRAGLRRNRGLNENLAREILELHTLGVDGGYTQGDVTNLARIITGWTVGRGEATPDRAGHFVFAEVFHEPSRWTVLGKIYGDDGLASGEAALADLARHPATARHIARKFATHFISDNPPAGLVSKLEASFRDTGGDLAALARTLVAEPESWEAAPAKVIPPWDFLVSLHRGLGVEAKAPETMRLAAALGQPIWQVSSPKGWPDADNAWMGPSAVRERLRIAERVARDMPASADPRAVVKDLLGPGASEHTIGAIARAETREQGFELLVMAPEFQRR
jgi:uncharacterized protein (DUF1800 family)